MPQQIDKSDTMAPAARLSPAQRALFCTLKRILIAALKVLDELLATE
jgi:hypothetical protein